MSNVVNRVTGGTCYSVHTPDFPVVDWIVNPPSLALLDEAEVPLKYREIVGDDVQEMDPIGKALVDAAEEALVIAAELAEAKAEGIVTVITEAYTRGLTEDDVVAVTDSVEAATSSAEVSVLVAAYLSS